jgi:putative membrane protein
LDEWKRIDATFLLLLAVGALLAIESCAWLLDFLLTEHPGETLAFFLGLIIPSLGVPYRMMDRRGLLELLWVFPGAAVTVLIALSDVSGGGENASFLIVFLGGILAVSAMILPGISGSFCLLILGLYHPTLKHIKALVHDPTVSTFIFMAALGSGVIVGFVTFTRLMSFLLKRFRSATLAFLIGLILGSFWVLWPIKDFEGGQEDLKKKIQIATAPNRLPGDREGDLVFCGRLGLAALAGLVGAMGVNHIGSRNRKLEEEKVGIIE